MAGQGIEDLKTINIFAAFAGALGAFRSSRMSARQAAYDLDADSKDRKRIVSRSKKQSLQGVVWYAAPVLWLPILMLSTLWFFS